MYWALYWREGGAFRLAGPTSIFQGEEAQGEIAPRMLVDWYPV